MFFLDVTLDIVQFHEKRNSDLMIKAKEAIKLILDATENFSTETILTEKASGHILRETIKAERDQPPFDRVMMDGIALSWNDYSQGQLNFPIQAMQAAGDKRLVLKKGSCIEIMTGAALPRGSDSIVPFEELSIVNDVAQINTQYKLKKNQYIHPRATDFPKGKQLLKPGKRISAFDIAIITSCGKKEVVVSKDPIIRVISTGNELVEPGKPIKPHEIRMSNGPAIVSLLKSHNYKKIKHDHIVDDISKLEEHLAIHLKESNVLILIGGVSKGKADYIPQVLHSLGVKVIFHKVSQSPGKPLWFGKGPEGQLVFALPGNPVSALICCRQYVLKSLLCASYTLKSAPEYVKITSKIYFKPSLTLFKPVKLKSDKYGQVLAIPITYNTSGDFASLSDTDGYIELPQNKTYFPKGSIARLHRWIAQ